MTILLLFVILFVLIYIAGLLPGVIKAVALSFGILLVVFMGKVYGWGVVAAGVVGVAAASALAVYLTYRSIYGESFKPPKPVVNTDEQLARINEKNKAINKREEELRREKAEKPGFIE